MSWYLTVLRNYAVFDGRARRKEYWMFVLINTLIGFVVQMADGMLGTVLLSIIYSLVMLIPIFAVSVRRLHDVDKSGWWLLIMFVPIIGALVLLYFTVIDGTTGNNRYGLNPKQQ